MEPRILALADVLASELFADGSLADLVERYARRLPLSVICELLGLPSADRPRFIAWAQTLTRLTGVLGFLRNMDPATHVHPETLDLARRPNRRLSFGTGIHFCLGHQRARIEAKCALEALFRQWPRLALATPATAIRWRRRPGMRAIVTPMVAPSSLS